MKEPKITRNKDLVRMRLNDPWKWGYGTLGEHFNIDKTVAHDIFERDVAKYAKAAEIKKYRSEVAKITAKYHPVGLSTVLQKEAID